MSEKTSSAPVATDKQLHPTTIRLTEQDWARLEKAAVMLRKKNGANETASSVARKILALGLAQIEGNGDLIVIV